jgi:beta-lactamase superfamily II metal-dependent hydrolase
MSTLRVRAYNVRFGDAILVSVPDRDAQGREETRHILFDVGNVLSGAGGVDDVFEPVIRDVLEELDGRPLDLYVSTHEHLDHVQGLLFASEQFGLDLDVQHVWLPASAATDYYDRFPSAKKRRLQLEQTFDQIQRYLDAAEDQPSALVHSLRLNNDYRSTAKCVDFLRQLADPTYVFRGADLTGAHPFTEARLSVWAPEEDTTVYYGSFQPMALGVGEAAEPGTAAAGPAVIPPSGVDAGAFYQLVELRRQTAVDNLLGIDKANNNTSVVVCLEWRGWRLLFPGDAEHRSWKEMDKRGVLAPVHFLKVAHHGSWNGTPPLTLLDKLLPVDAVDERPRRALVSTCADTYHNVPDAVTLEEVGRRTDEVVTVGHADGPGFVDLEFEAGGGD